MSEYSGRMQRYVGMLFYQEFIAEVNQYRAWRSSSGLGDGHAAVLQWRDEQEAHIWREGV